MRLLHLSDVHFHGAAHGWDEDADQRAQIVMDVRIDVAANGPFDALLFGGDIAFRASAEEYLLATIWLDELIIAGGLEGRHRVFTVPGNHDIDRQVILDSVALKDFRKAIAESAISEIDETLRVRLSADPAGAPVFAHLDAYNEFAAQYLCAVSPGKPTWVYPDFVLDGWRVRLVGLTSVINCGPGDESATDGEQQLVLGSQQCRMSRSEADITLVMMHHPPEWIRDWPVVKPHLSRAHVWLFGHEHSFGARQSLPGGTVEIRAGAVAPQRTAAGEEAPFLPSFNFIELSRNGEQLLVQVRARVWDIALTRYQAMEPLEFNVELDPLANGTGDVPIGTHDNHDDSMSASPLSIGSELVPMMSSPSTSDAGQSVDLRRVAINFMTLPTNRRNDIARSMGVLSDADLLVPATELYPLLLRRIAEHELIHTLIEELAA